MKIPLPTEEQECQTLIAYLELKKHLFSHIPSGAYATNWATRIKSKRLGLRPGLPDYIIIINNNLVFLEMKRRRGSRGGGGGVVSDKQSAWIEALTKTGNRCFVCHGAGEAIAAVQEVERL